MRLDMHSDIRLAMLQDCRGNDVIRVWERWAMHHGAAEGVRAAGEWQDMRKGWTCIQISSLQCCMIAVGMMGSPCGIVKQCITQLWRAHKQDGLVMAF